MTDHFDGDPHREYRRQAAEHFDLPELPPAPPPGSLDGPSQRFAAGTTYGGSGHAHAPPAQPPAPASWGAVPVQPAASAQLPPSYQPGPPAPPAYPGAIAPDAGLNLQPSHALWILTGLSLICVYASGLGWLLVAAVCAAGAWHTQTKHISWPPDIQEVLVRARLTQPTRGNAHIGSAAAPFNAPSPQSAPAVAFIPFRPLTVSELFGGAFRIMRSYWPTLVGIPVAILVVFLIVFMSAGYVAVEVMSGMMTSSMSAGMSLDGMMATMTGMWIIGTLLLYVIALPADALLIALTVISTHKAVRGEPVRLIEVFRLARGRMFAVCRLTLGYYALFVVVDLLYSAVVMLALGEGVSALLLGIPLFVGCFAIGILTSLAPIVLVVEGRGVADSLKRAMQLAKPAFSRLLLIHFMWAVCVLPILIVPAVIFSYILGFFGALLTLALSFGVLIAFFRTLQMLIYTDLRMRQENYEQELIADWTRNTAR